MTMIVGFLKGGGGAALPPPPMSVEPVVTLASLDTTVAEGGSLAGALGIDPPFGATTTVTLTITGQGVDPAEVPADIQATLAVNVPGGAASHAFSIPVVDDVLEEGAEGGRVTVQAGAGYSVGSPASRDFTIEASDAPVINPQNITVSVPTSGAWLDVEMDGTVTANRYPSLPSSNPNTPHPDYVPHAVTLVVRRSGFTRSGGQAVAATWDYTVTAYGPEYQRVHSDDVPPQPLPLEANLGGGRMSTRLRLTQPICAGDVIVSCSFASGWRTGAGAAEVSVSNTSTRAYTAPRIRRLTLNNEYVSTLRDCRLDWGIGADFPRHFGASHNEAVAGVRFFATDGTNTNSVWVTEDSASTQYGDDELVWGLMAQGSGLMTGLTPGRVTVGLEVYPWVGPMVSRGLTHLTTDNGWRAIAPDTGLQVIWLGDETGSFSPRFVAVDPAGTATASAGLVYTTEAAALAGSYAANIQCALESLRLAGITDPRRMRVVVRSGTVTMTGTTVNAGIVSGGFPVLVYPDPGATSPRTNCIVSHTAPPSANTGRRFFYRNLRVQRTSGALMNNTGSIHFDRCDIHNADTASGNIMDTTFGTATEAPFEAAGCAFTAAAGALELSRFSLNNLFGLVRSCTSTSTMNGLVIWGCSINSATLTAASFVLHGDTTDHVFAFNRHERAGDANFVSISGTGTRSPANSGTWRRFWLGGNYYERRQSGWTARALNVETTNTEAWLVEGNTVMGAGFNWGYNDGGATTGFHSAHVVRGSIFDRWASKVGDDNPRAAFTDEEYSRAHELSYGLMCSTCMVLNRVDSTDRNQLFDALDWLSVGPPNIGLGNNVPAAPFVSERHHTCATPDSGATPSDLTLTAGFGKGRGWVGSVNRDVGGNARGTTSSIGAIAA